MNIFTLSAQYQSIMNHIDCHDEIDSLTMQELESISDDLDNKILNYASMIKTIDAKVNAMQIAVNTIKKRIDNLQSSKEKLTSIVKTEMDRCDKTKIENEYHLVKLINNPPSVKIDECEKIPQEYMRKIIKETIEPNTQLISKLLKDNLMIPGCRLVQGKRLDIK